LVAFEVIDDLDVFNEVPGWRLHLAHLALEPGPHDQVLEVITRGTRASLGRKYPGGDFRTDPNIRAVRRATGDRGTVSSEIILQRVLDGGEMPSLDPVRLFRDLLELRTQLPWSAVDAEEVLFPWKFKSGETGETCDTPRGTCDLEGLPLLIDGRGPVASPCAPVEETRLKEATSQVIMVCYTPVEVAREFAARTQLARMVWTTWAFRFVSEKAIRAMEQ